MKYFQIALLALLIPVCCLAQEQQETDGKDQEKKIFEAIQKEIEHYSVVLDLEDWQIFYADSVLTHNYAEMFKEFRALSNAKVSNRDLYTNVDDKWKEASYQAFRKFLSPEQWAKYEKSGASREKKARDKRKQNVR